MANFEKFTNWFWEEFKKWSWLILIFLGLLIIFFKSRDIDLTVKVATIFGVFAAAASVAHLAQQIKISVKEEKVKRAYEYMKRYNAEDFRKNAAVALNFLKNIEQPEIEKLQILANGHKKELKDVELRSKVLFLLNFFEEMGGMYNKNLLDKKMIEEFFQSMSKIYYTYATTYIQKRREKPRNSENFKNWETMNKDF